MTRIKYRLPYKIVIKNNCFSLDKKRSNSIQELIYWCYNNTQKQFYSNIIPIDEFNSFYEFIFCFDDPNDAIVFKLYSSVILEK